MVNYHTGYSTISPCAFLVYLHVLPCEKLGDNNVTNDVDSIIIHTSTLHLTSLKLFGQTNKALSDLLEVTLAVYKVLYSSWLNKHYKWVQAYFLLQCLPMLTADRK